MPLRALFALVASVIADVPLGPRVIKSKGETNRCVDVQGTSNGQFLLSRPCDGSATQAWRFDIDGQLVLDADHSKCVDVEGGDVNKDGSHLEIWACTGLPQQKWHHDSGKSSIWIDDNCLWEPLCHCMVLSNNSMDLGSGTSVLMGHCLGTLLGNRQYWQVQKTDPAPAPTPLPTITGAITNPTGTDCLELPGGSPSNGQLLRVAPCSGAANQRWAQWNGRLAFDGGAAWTHCVDVPGGDTGNGKTLEVWQCGSYPSQQWAVGDFQGHGTIRMETEAKCLSAKTAPAPMTIWDCAQQPQGVQQFWQFAEGGSVMV